MAVTAPFPPSHLTAARAMVKVNPVSPTGVNWMATISVPATGLLDISVAALAPSSKPNARARFRSPFAVASDASAWRLSPGKQHGPSRRRPPGGV